MYKQLTEDFHQLYQTNEPVRVFFAPGRVNLIGEHTDYNGGHVFPCALTVGTYAIVRQRTDRQVRMYSKNFEDIGVIHFHLDDITYDKKHDWANYPKGVIRIMQQRNLNIEYGFDVLFFGNIPNGAGLSSSASIELATAVLANELGQLNVSMIELVKISQQAENEFIGVSCGIMDQFAIGMGQKDQAVLLNSDTLSYTYSPVKLQNEALIITNTNKRRGLADSKYNERRQQCEQALAELQTVVNITSLGDLTVEQFEQHKDAIKDDVRRKRAEHAVYENHRTQEAVTKLKQGDIAAFGKLMNDSHKSLRDLYEVTGKELDALVEAAWAVEGVIGSRMTGAGFGGCTITIVEKDKVEPFKAQVGKQYEDATGLKADFYEVEIGDGARELVLNHS
ncbi:galactokinase [Salirhabdus salicampi]|uniref:galactokinase n=1 Tax=Salirhabdus salicampi TaxID=476102 RepID=UPI0020C2162E|nr:galactokinase [Salirhabdus salicampi]MCP8617551.1 galactokinase [Salirhabdus salicampi]